jgi:hypothetical protein
VVKAESRLIVLGMAFARKTSWGLRTHSAQKADHDTLRIGLKLRLGAHVALRQDTDTDRGGKEGRS